MDDGKDEGLQLHELQFLRACGASCMEHHAGTRVSLVES